MQIYMADNCTWASVCMSLIATWHINSDSNTYKFMKYKHTWVQGVPVTSSIQRKIMKYPWVGNSQLYTSTMLMKIMKMGGGLQLQFAMKSSLILCGTMLAIAAPSRPPIFCLSCSLTLSPDIYITNGKAISRYYGDGLLKLQHINKFP